MARGIPKESDLAAKVVKALRVRSGGLGFFVKIHGGLFQAAGLPDIVGCYKGRFIGIELKLPGKERNLTNIQKDTLDTIKRAGGISGMATSVDEAWAIIEEGV